MNGIRTKYNSLGQMSNIDLFIPILLIDIVFVYWELIFDITWQSDFYKNSCNNVGGLLFLTFLNFRNLKYGVIKVSSFFLFLLLLKKIQWKFKFSIVVWPSMTFM